MTRRKCLAAADELARKQSFKRYKYFLAGTSRLKQFRTKREHHLLILLHVDDKSDRTEAEPKTTVLERLMNSQYCMFWSSKVQKTIRHLRISDQLTT